MTTTTYPPTDKQVNFLLSLMKDRAGLDDAQVAAVVDGLIAVGTWTKKDVSAKIDALMKLPKPEKQYAPWPDVPAGFYATPSRTGHNDLDFWKVDRPDKGKWTGYTFVKRVIGGHPETRVRGAEARTALEAILAEGPKNAGKKYADEIGRCYICNLHLTDDLSRELGIGPVCRSK